MLGFRCNTADPCRDEVVYVLNPAALSAPRTLAGAPGCWGFGLRLWAACGSRQALIVHSRRTPKNSIRMIRAACSGHLHWNACNEIACKGHMKLLPARARCQVACWQLATFSFLADPPRVGSALETQVQGFCLRGEIFRAAAEGFKDWGFRGSWCEV